MLFIQLSTNNTKKIICLKSKTYHYCQLLVKTGSIPSNPLSWKCISFPIIEADVIESMPFKLLKCHRTKQFFLAAGCYSLRSYLSCSSVLFIANCTWFLGCPLWRVILLRFDASKIKATLHANAICESIFYRWARVIIRNALRKFGVFW